MRVPLINSMASRITLAVAPLLLVMIAGTVLLLLAHYRSTVSDLQESRFAYSASELRNSAESSLRLGLPLADLDQLEPAMADVLDRDIAILSIDLFDDQGRLLFTTDRAGIGESVPDPWTQATREMQGEFWRRTERGVAVLGAPIINSFDQLAGGLALRYDPRGGQAGGSGSTDAVYQWLPLAGAGLLALIWLAAYIALSGSERRSASVAARIDQSDPSFNQDHEATTIFARERLERFLERVGAARADMAHTGREIARIDEKD
jgi:hypothetical protein